MGEPPNQPKFNPLSIKKPMAFGDSLFQETPYTLW